LEEKNKNTNQIFTLNKKETYIFIIILFALLILFFIVCYNCENIREFGDYISKFFIAGTIIVAILQQLTTKQWNKKQITIQQLHKTRKVQMEMINYLSEYMNTRRKNSYEIWEIHSIMGVLVDYSLLKDNERYLLEKYLKGYIQTENDFKYISNNSEITQPRFIFFKNINHIEELKENQKQKLFNILNNIMCTKKVIDTDNVILYQNQKWKNQDGKVIYSKIHSLLGEFEYIGTSVNKGIFEFEIIYSLLKSSILHTFTTFKKYIKHFRKHTSDSLYEEFEKLENKMNIKEKIER